MISHGLDSVLRLDFGECLSEKRFKRVSFADTVPFGEIHVNVTQLGKTHPAYRRLETRWFYTLWSWINGLRTMFFPLRGESAGVWLVRFRRSR